MRSTRTLIIATLVLGLTASSAFARKPARSQDSVPPPSTRSEMYGPRYGMMAPLTEEEEQAALEFIRSIDPENAERIEGMKESSPRWYSISLRRVLMTQTRLDEMARRDSSLYKRHRSMFRLDARAEALATQYREARNDSERAQLHNELTTILEKLFDLREEDKRYEIERLERRLETLRGAIEERAKHKAEIVQRRADELIGANDSYEW